MPDEAVIYDPTDVQLRAWRPSELEDLFPDGLDNPKVMRYFMTISLTQVKSLEHQNVQLTRAREELRGHCESLRVDLARYQERERHNISWAEIGVSILSGLSINTLLSDPKSISGWILFALSVAVLISLRLPHVLARWDVPKRKEEENA